MVKTRLAPGFRFSPTDVELVKYYLKRKVLGKKFLIEAIAEIDIYKFEPSDLPDKSYIRTGDLKWYFFCPREKKYASGVRMNRATEFGYWKTTGKDRDVLCNNQVVGKIKTLVFHRGKSPRGERTDWVMHEYRLEDKELAQMDVVQDAFVLCVLFKKDGPGPRNGAQYGAPFKEEEWSEEEEDTYNVTALPSVDSSTYPSGINRETNVVVMTSEASKDYYCGGMISESCVSDVMASASMPLPLNNEVNTPTPTPLIDSNSTLTSAEATQTPDDNIYSMLNFFVDDERYSQNEVRHESRVSREEAPLCLEADDVFGGLPDLSNFDHESGTASYGLFESYKSNPSENTPLFLELEDLTESLTCPVAQSENLGNAERVYLNQDQFGLTATRHGPLSSQSLSQDSRFSHLSWK